jgi:hypothetical protein
LEFTFQLMSHFPPVHAFSWKGKVTVFLVKTLLFLVSIFKGKDWQFPRRNFEENPRYFKWMDIAYLAYKYYYKLFKTAEQHAQTVNNFQQQKFSAPQGNPALTISLGGDLMPYAAISKDTCRGLWDEVGDFFFSSDMVFANLETPIDTSKAPVMVPEVMLNDMCFNADEEIFTIFNGNNKYRGFDVLSVANNHSLDQGKDGLLQTLRFLDQQNIAYCGAAPTSASVYDFPILHRKGISVAFIAFTFSLNQFDLGNEGWRCNHMRLNQPEADISLIVDQASAARSRGADLIIASLHMGNAYQPYPGEHIRNNIHRICREAGIDVVIAGHPHNPQPVEWIEFNDGSSAKRKSLVFYSPGDFVAYDIYAWAHLSLLIKLNVMKTAGRVYVSDFEILPAYLLAEFQRNKIAALTFRHFEAAFKERESYPRFIQRDLNTIDLLYRNLLFTAQQREKIITPIDYRHGPVRDHEWV